MGAADVPTVEVDFDPEEYERLLEVTDSPEDLLREAAMSRVERAEAIAYTRDGGFHGPEGFA